MACSSGAGNTTGQGGNGGKGGASKDGAASTGGGTSKGGASSEGGASSTGGVSSAGGSYTGESTSSGGVTGTGGGSTGGATGSGGGFGGASGGTTSTGGPAVAVARLVRAAAPAAQPAPAAWALAARPGLAVPVGAVASSSCPAGGDAGVTTVTINNTGPWNDTTGKHIQAHGGGLIKVCDTWYWFGEDKTLNTNGTGNFHAISCYASKDLVNWEHRNSVVTTSTASVLNNTNLIIERPKVIYNASTKLFVMWAHWDMESCSGASGGYCDSEAVVFTSPTVDGNYTYVNHFQPNGDGSRDCTLWQEPDGTAYFVSTGGPGGNAAGDFHDTEAYQLTSDYLSVQTPPRSGRQTPARRTRSGRSTATITASARVRPAGPQPSGLLDVDRHDRRTVEQQLSALLAQTARPGAPSRPT